MDKALRERLAAQRRTSRKLDWRKRMSDHVAYALLVYTGLQIFVTMQFLKTGHGSILPYFALIVLVVAIIPGCRMFEKRWEGISDSEAADPALAGRFWPDIWVLWILAVGLPLLLTGLFKGVSALL
jgi:uncharacterized membrane protein SirB2